MFPLSLVRAQKLGASFAYSTMFGASVDRIPHFKVLWLAALSRHSKVGHALQLCSCFGFTIVHCHMTSAEPKNRASCRRMKIIHVSIIRGDVQVYTRVLIAPISSQIPEISLQNWCKYIDFRCHFSTMWAHGIVYMCVIGRVNHKYYRVIYRKTCFRAPRQSFQSHTAV